MAQTHMVLRAVDARQGEEIRLPRRSALFPLTLTLSLGEREQRAMGSGGPTAVECSPGRDGLTLSPWERAGVRGNDAKYLPRIGPIPVLSNWTSPPAERRVSQNDDDFPPAQCPLRVEKTPARRRAALRPGHSPKTFRRPVVRQP